MAAPITKFLIFLLMLDVGIVLPGCRSAGIVTDSGTSSMTTIDPPKSPAPANATDTKVEMTGTAQYCEAHAVGSLALPAYPTRALAARAGVATVGVHVTIDTAGRVAGIRSSLWVFTTPGPFAADFRDAVEAALRQWKFVPAEIRQIEIVEEHGFSYPRVIHVEKTETELDLAFTFSPTGRVERTGKP